MLEIPVYGAIIMNKTADKILLVMNFNCTNYSFPKGKVNMNENGISCAIREVW
jgi:mRNA-decapping enzyme subunit 2